MKILIACEKSARVRDAFQAQGHDAWSCDLEASDGSQDRHYRANILDILLDESLIWDLMIAHPPCTYLCNSGVRWLKNNSKRQANLAYAAMFFRTLLECDVPRICIENPIPHKYAIQKIGRKYDQIIQPWQFGEDASKATCLWLKNLPKLKPTKIIKKKRYANQTPSGQNNLGPSPERAMLRAKTYQGIADAMADQWGR